MDEWMDCFYFLNDPLLAKDHFENFYKNVGYPISVARGAYWLGRTYKIRLVKNCHKNGLVRLQIIYYLLWSTCIYGIRS